MENTITKERLAEMYSQLSNKQLCEQLDITVMALYKLLDEAGIPRKKSWTKRTRLVLAD